MIGGPDSRINIKAFGVPSLFDFLVVIFIAGLPAVHTTHLINANWASALWLVFGSLTLWTVSLALPQRRAYGSLPLAMLTLWVMVNVFFKSWRTPGCAEWFITWSMLNEGCIQVLAAGILISTIVKYGKEYGWYYLALITVIIGWFANSVFPLKSMSPLLALLVCVPIMAIKLRERAVAALLTLPLCLIAIIRWDWLVMKWGARPMMWSLVWDGMNKSPEKFFLGVGFPNDINSMFGWIPSPQGLGYIQNDYLEFTRSHGAVGLGLVVWFLVTLFKGAKLSLAYYLGLSAAILCFFQRTIYFPIQAGIIMVIISLLILENGRLKELLPVTEAGGYDD